MIDLISRSGSQYSRQAGVEQILLQDASTPEVDAKRTLPVSDGHFSARANLLDQ